MSVTLKIEPWAIPPAISNHDWQRAVRDGVEMAESQIRSDKAMDELDVIWALLCDAAQVSGHAYSGPPAAGYPIKSTMPESGDEVTQWQMMSAYLRGEVQEIPDGKARVQPTAHQISRAEAVLDVWHLFALTGIGNRKKLKKALYLRACGVKMRRIRAVTGITRQQLHRAKQQAMGDMWGVIRRY